MDSLNDGNRAGKTGLAVDFGAEAFDVEGPEEIETGSGNLCQPTGRQGGVSDFEGDFGHGC